MFSFLGWFSSENIQKIFNEKQDSLLIIFHVHEDDSIPKFQINGYNFYFIKIQKLIVNGKFIKNGFLVYETNYNLQIAYFDSNVDLILSRLKNHEISTNQSFIMSNIIKDDDGNNLLFSLFNLSGKGAKIIGLDFENCNQNSIYYNGNFYDYFFLLFKSDQNFSYINNDKFWEDYLGPFIITEAFDGGFKNISWQNPIGLFHNKIHSLSYDTLENSIKYFPLKVMSLKGDYSIIKLKVDFGKSIDNFYNDISVFSYQYAFIEKCNVQVLFDAIRRIKKENKFQLKVFAGDLSDIVIDYLNNSLKLKRILSLKNFYGITCNLIVLPTKSTPIMTTDCIFAI